MVIYKSASNFQAWKHFVNFLDAIYVMQFCMSDDKYCL